MRLLLLLLLTASMGAIADDKTSPPDNRPPDNRPPDRAGVGDISQTLTNENTVSTSSESVSEANVTNNLSLFPAEGVAGQSTSGGGNSIVSINEAKRPDDITIRNTPSMVAPDIFPTVSCFKGTSFAIGVPGAGGSFGGGKIDPECTRREEIRLAAQIGLAAQALFRWCGLENNVLEFGSREGCMSYGAPVSAPPAATQNYITESEHDSDAQALLQSVEEVVAHVEDTNSRVAHIEQRLNANAAVARAEDKEREEWKVELAARYLTETEPDQ